MSQLSREFTQGIETFIFLIRDIFRFANWWIMYNEKKEKNVPFNVNYNSVIGFVCGLSERILILNFSHVSGICIKICATESRDYAMQWSQQKEPNYSSIYEKSTFKVK